jgi:hypothetical protein
MKNEIIEILRKKGINSSIIEWLKIVYPILVKTISPQKLDKALTNYDIKIRDENEVTKELIEKGITGIHNEMSNIIELLVKSYNEIGIDNIATLVHEIGHACSSDDASKYRLTISNNRYIDEMLEEVYVDRLKIHLHNDIGETSDTNMDLNNKKVGTAELNLTGKKIIYTSSINSKGYSQYEPLLFLVEAILGKDKYLINELYNAQEVESKEKISKTIREKLSDNLTDKQYEMYENICLGYTCCTDKGNKLDNSKRLDNLSSNYFKQELSQENIKRSKQWIENNPNRNLGDIIEQVGMLTEEILLNRIKNVKNEDPLDLMKDTAFYINYVDIAGEESKRYQIRDRFFKMSDVFISKLNLNCNDYTHNQKTGMLLGLLSNRCIKNSEIYNIKIIDYKSIKKNISDFSKNEIVISLGNEMYQYTVHNEVQNNRTDMFGLEGRGLNNKINPKVIYPDGITRGNENYYIFNKLNKKIDIEDVCI